MFQPIRQPIRNGLAAVCCLLLGHYACRQHLNLILWCLVLWLCWSYLLTSCCKYWSGFLYYEDFVLGLCKHDYGMCNKTVRFKHPSLNYDTLARRQVEQQWQMCFQNQKLTAIKAAASKHVSTATRDRRSKQMQPSSALSCQQDQPRDSHKADRTWTLDLFPQVTAFTFHIIPHKFCHSPMLSTSPVKGLCLKKS